MLGGRWDVVGESGDSSTFAVDVKAVSLGEALNL